MNGRAKHQATALWRCGASNACEEEDSSLDFVPMVDLSIVGDTLVLHVEGADKLWALRSSLEIPLRHVAGVRADASVARGWWHGLKMLGTSLPGVITAGSFYQDGKRVFWDVHNPENTIVIELIDDQYDELIVEVADPNFAVEVVRGVLLRG